VNNLTINTFNLNILKGFHGQELTYNYACSTQWRQRYYVTVERTKVTSQDFPF